MTHQILLTWRGQHVKTLEDLIPPNPKGVFVGINPSPVSVRAVHYHQGTLGKKFWARLNRYGIVSLKLNGFEDDQVFDAGFGLTDIAKRPTGSEDDLQEEDFNEGRPLLEGKVREWNPRYVCFIYKKAANKFLRLDLTGRYGLLTGTSIGKSRVFLMPAPYASKDEEMRIMLELKELLNS